MDRKTLSLLMSLLFLMVVGVNAQTKYTAKSYDVLIAGTSNVHDWTSKVTTVNVTGDFEIVNGAFNKLNSAVVTAQAKSIKSTKNSDLMDDRTYSTIKADKNPTIAYVCTKLLATQKNGAETLVTVLGNLTIAGVTKPAELVLHFKSTPAGDLQVTGSKKLLLSDHDIKAPSFMLGAMKVGNEITITFDVVLKKV